MNNRIKNVVQGMFALVLISFVGACARSFAPMGNRERCVGPGCEEACSNGYCGDVLTGACTVELEAQECEMNRYCSTTRVCTELPACHVNNDPVCLAQGLECDLSNTICSRVILTPDPIVVTDTSSKTCTVNMDCDDGNYCNGSELCAKGKCLAGVPACDGAFPFCIEATDTCQACRSDSDCVDTLFCNGPEVCSGGSCKHAGNPCSGNSPNCLESTDSCGACIANADCDDGLYCTGQETCSNGICQAGALPCAEVSGSYCSELDDQCVACTHNSQCSDGNVCNGVELCVNNTCQAGNVISCNDSNPCTDDACSPSQGCVYSNNTAPCLDGNACTTLDTCQAGSCGGGAAPNCNDNNVCTDDTCVPASGCVHNNNTISCSDGAYCNGSEVCQNGTCAAGTNPCAGQTPSCNETLDTCECTQNSDCSNGLFCDGNELCVAGACVSGSAPCGGTTPVCSESTDTCICSQDSHCSNGLFCDGTETCVAGACQAGTNPCSGAGQTCDEGGDVCVSSILFSDDFSDGVLTGWTLVAGELMREAGGTMRTEADNNTDTFYKITSGDAWTSYRMTVKILPVDDDEIALPFRIQNSNSYYRVKQAFGDNDGWNLRLEKVSGGSAVALKPAVNNSAQVSNLNAWYTFRIEVTGSASTNIKVYINNILKFDHTDISSPYTVGSAGIWSDNQLNFQIDDVLVETLP